MKKKQCNCQMGLNTRPVPQEILHDGITRVVPFMWQLLCCVSSLERTMHAKQLGNASCLAVTAQRT